MKVQELRQLMSKADREHLEKAFAESYKQLRKAQKEEIDSILIDILEGKTGEKKKKEEKLSFEELEQQINIFIENAYAQNYLAPNRVIPKNQRPKWRFLVKNFIKELEKITVEDDDHPKAVKLLTDLYRMICYACDYYLFSTEDPFRSIGWEQPDLFGLLVKKTFAAGYTREDISRLLLCACTGGLSRESLHIVQEMVLLQELKTSDVKYMAVEEAKKLVDERTGMLAGLKKYDSKRFSLEGAVDELCGMVLLITIALGEEEQGIDYYFKRSREEDKEIILYRALDRVDWMEKDDLWLKVYEYGVRKKIEPRKRLKEEYEKRKSQMIL